jgi:hypothetical protein
MTATHSNKMVFLTYSVEERSMFDDMANRDSELNLLRDEFDFDKWMSDREETFMVSENFADRLNDVLTRIMSAK